MSRASKQSGSASDDPAASGITLFEYLRSVVYLLRDQQTEYLLWFGLLVIIHFALVLPPLFVGRIVDVLTYSSSPDRLSEVLKLALAMAFCATASAYVRLTAKNKLGNMHAHAIAVNRADAFDRLTERAFIDTDSLTTGEKVARIQDGMTAFLTLSRLVQNEVLYSSMSLIGAVSIFLAMNPRYAMFFILYWIIFWCLLQFSFGKLTELNHRLARAKEVAGGAYVEGLSNATLLRVTGAASGMTSRHRTNEEEIKNLDITVRKSIVRTWKAFQCLNGIALAASLYFVASDVVGGVTALGYIVVFFGALEKVTNSAGEVLSSYEVIVQSRASLGRMIITLKGLAPIISGDKSFPRDWQSIEIEEGKFQHKTTDAARFQLAVSLSVKKGDKLGIVGQSGSGKSSLAKLLAGVWKWDGGRYEIGNVSFAEISSEEALKNVAFVPQETEMLNLSLQENITLFRELGEGKLGEAIERACLGDLIASLPQGLNTPVGEKGYRLSGGERQRVGLARALCRSPQIMILDEATSALDSETEERVLANLSSLDKDITLIIIAHRVNTLSDTNRIVEMSDGKIVNEDTYERLYGA
jgi:ABC-type multidrug transport system fused ATPase/permease subunit